MNLKHPYEKHLAEKLVQLPPPDDPDQHWQQMKGLLDKNMPRGGGGSGGTYRWWITGTVIVAVVIGTWFGGKQLLTREQRNEAVAGTIKTVNNKKLPSVAPTDENTASDGSAAAKTGGTTGTKNNLPGAAYASTTSTPDANTVAARDQQPSGTANNRAINNNNASEKDAVVANNTTHSNALTLEDAERARSSGNTDNSTLLPASNHKEPNETPVNNNNKTNVDRNKLYAPVTKNNKNKTTGSNHTTNNRSTNNHRNENNTGTDSYRDQPENNSVVTNTAAEKSSNGKEKRPVRKAVANRPVNKSAKEVLEEKEERPYAYTPSISSPSRSLPSQPSNGSGLKESPVTYNINYTGSSVVAPSGIIQREFTYYTQAELFPDMVVHNKPAKRKRSPNSDDDDATFALGLSLPLAFPVGDQQALGYNRNAGVNTISDYIPSPHFQYHFNNKTYLQAGLQFSSPQFIRPVLLYQSQMYYQQGPNLMEQTTSISARKLYYFNLPVTIYHSPLRNFYMGTGLMYSSLLSGVAYYEKTEKKFGPGPPLEYVVKNYFSKFKNDSLSGRLNGNEVRLIIDMSYYWSRFTVGLQYNQAFNNYVSLQVTPNSAYTLDKNKSLQFYLRYNFWEDKKRKQPKGQVLTLK